MADPARKLPGYTPEDALDLLHEWDRILWACNISENPAFHHADARTRAHDGRRIVDAYRSKKAVDWAAEIQETVSLSPDELAGRVPPLLVKTINRKGAPLPWGPPSGPHATLGGIDLYGLLASAKERDIVIPCAFRRMLDNQFESVLVLTAEHLLPQEARAYRQGHRDAVRRMIREVARAVASHRRYWAKLDLKSFFPSMPWAGLEQALDELGYPREFVAKLMALVKASLVDPQGSPISNTQGCQAGLRISGILANILLRDLDLHITGRFGKTLIYWRYSDDIILVGWHREDLVGAARAVHHWAGEHSLRINGVAT